MLTRDQVDAVLAFCKYADAQGSPTALVHNIVRGHVPPDMWEALASVELELPAEPPPPRLPWATERPPVQRAALGPLHDESIILSPIVVPLPSGDMKRDADAYDAIEFEHVSCDIEMLASTFEQAVTHGAVAGRAYLVSGRRGFAPMAVQWREHFGAAALDVSVWDGEAWEAGKPLVSELEPWGIEAIAWAKGQLARLKELDGGER